MIKKIINYIFLFFLIIIIFFQLFFVLKKKTNLNNSNKVFFNKCQNSFFIEKKYWAQVSVELKFIISNINNKLSSDSIKLISNTIIKCSKKFSINPYIITLIIYQESRFVTDVRGYSGDAGLMQIIPTTAEYISVKTGLKNYNIIDIYTNIYFGCWYLRNIMDIYYCNYFHALARYNSGGFWNREGKKYANSILRNAERLNIPLKKILYFEKLNRPITIKEIYL